MPEGVEPRNWSELEEQIAAQYGLESADICLLPDFVGSESVDRLDVLTVSELEERAVLLELSVGFRVRLAIHLNQKLGSRGVNESPSDSACLQIAIEARAVFERMVSDRVVALMAVRDSDQVAWLYLNGDGAIESASAGARRFCDRYCVRSSTAKEYLHSQVLSYLQRLLRTPLCKESMVRGNGFAFAFSAGTEVVQCLLKSMVGSGYLLTLWMED